MKFVQYLWTRRTTINREISGEEMFNVLYFLCILHLLADHQPTQLLIVSHRHTVPPKINLV